MKAANRFRAPHLFVMRGCCSPPVPVDRLFRETGGGYSPRRRHMQVNKIISNYYLKIHIYFGYYNVKFINVKAECAENPGFRRDFIATFFT
jgi:hypothetical protein